MGFKSIVLAAGKGTRMKSDLPKVIHKVNGISMLKKVINVLDEAGSKENILILGHKKELVLETLGEVSYVLQEEQLGTGHAVQMAEEKIADYEGLVLVTCGDTPLIRVETIKSMILKHKLDKATATILTAIEENPFGYGRIVKENGFVKAIVEEKDANEEIKAIKEINAGVYCFESKKLLDALRKIDNNNANGEYYLTDVIKVMVDQGDRVDSFSVKDNKETMGVNSKVQLAQASKVLRERKNIELMDAGVIMVDPNTVYIEESVQIGRDTVIYPNVVIEGDTTIGENCEILSNTRIVQCKIDNNVKVEASVLEHSNIAEGVTIGPFAHVRPKTNLMKKVHIGNFVETKNSTLNEGVKAGHLTYIGDSIVGENTNFGAGTITCNYDGKNKYQTIIGKNVFIGSDTKFVAPVVVGDDAITAAGSVITKNIPDRALAVARARQENKKEWKKK
jgi:bifunctional UDP-N-acetylglucosamine pyrophosphorylase/glucosamine-1-phosphate N-acetyltransferase